MAIAAEISLCKVHLCKLWVKEKNWLELWLQTEVKSAKLQIMMVYIRSQNSNNYLNGLSFKVFKLYYNYIFFIALYCIQNIYIDCNSQVVKRANILNSFHSSRSQSIIKISFIPDFPTSYCQSVHYESQWRDMSWAVL